MKAYKQIINYQKRQLNDLAGDLPLFHLLINFRSFYGVNCQAMKTVYNIVTNSKKLHLDPEYQLRIRILSQTYYYKCHREARTKGYITYFNEKTQRYESKLAGTFRTKKEPFDYLF